MQKTFVILGILGLVLISCKASRIKKEYLEQTEEVQTDINVIESKDSVVVLSTSEVDTSLNYWSSFDITMLDDKLKSFSFPSDSVTVLNFWFTTCRPCILEMPDLNEVYESYKSKKVRFLAITFSSKEEVNKFTEKRSFLFPKSVNQDIFIRGKGVEGFPTNIVLRQNGEVLFQEVGLYSDIKVLLSDAIEKGLKK